jgi:hypothetical protein
MRINKAVITAAGEYHSNLPLQSVVDRSGNRRTALRCTLDEVVEAGIQEIDRDSRLRIFRPPDLMRRDLFSLNRTTREATAMRFCGRVISSVTKLVCTLFLTICT